MSARAAAARCFCPPGDLVGVFVQQLRDAERLRDRLQTRFQLRCRRAAEHEREQDVVPQRERVEEIKLLEHEAEILPAEGGERVFLHAVEPLALQLHRAAGGLVECCEQV